MASVQRTIRDLGRRFEKQAAALKELDIAGTDAEAQALIMALIEPGIGGALDAIEAIINTVSAQTEGGYEAEDSAEDDADDTDFDDEDGEDGDDTDEEFADDEDSENDDEDEDDDADSEFADDEDDDDFADDGEDGDDDDFADGDDEEDEEEEPAPRRPARGAAKPVAKPAKPAAKPAAPVKNSKVPAASAASPKLSKQAQKVQAMNTADMRAFLLEGQPKRAAAIDKALEGVGGRAKATTLFAYAQKRGWIA
jgi:hypothetical protein